MRYLFRRSRMARRRQALRVATGLGLAAAILAWSGAAAGSLDLSVRNGHVTLEAHAVPLGEVLRKLSEEADFKLVMKKEPGALVTWRFRDVPVDQAVTRLLASVSSVALYAPTEPGAGPILTELRILRGGGKSTPLVEPLVEPLVDRRGRLAELQAPAEPSPAARERLASASPGIPNSAADIRPASREVGPIDPGLEDGEPRKRRDAALNAAKRRPDMAREALSEALSDPDMVVRQRAVQGLARLGGEATVTALSQVLLEDPEPRVRRMAAAGLGRVSTESAFWALMEANSDADAGVREAVSAALVALERRGVGARSEAPLE